MVASRKPCWFKLITDGVLEQAGGQRYKTDPLAADEYAGDNTNKLDVLSPTGTYDAYALVESQRKK